MENEPIRALVVGNGAREHAYIWKMRQSPRLEKVYTTIGNAGINKIATPLEITPEDIYGIVQAVADEKINFVMSGPEVPYSLGLINQLQEAFKGKTDFKRYFFGPTEEASRIETSKSWAADFNKRHGIPQADYIYGDSPEEVKLKIANTSWQGFAAKADELDGGKGVVICHSLEEAYSAVDNFMVKKIHGPKVGNRVMVQELLEGPELTVMAWVDKEGNHAIMPFARDNKALKGKNTGGMGVTSPISLETPSQSDKIHSILRKAIDGMREEDHPFVGLLYAGFILPLDDAKIIEWNCRGGDPEIESILPLYSEKFDLIEGMIKCVEGRVKQKDFWWRTMTSNTTVVLATPGYPDDPKVGQTIYGLDRVMDPRIQIFHGGTEDWNGQVIATRGRVLAISATADLLRESRQLAYSAIGEEGIHFDGMQYLENLA